MENYIGMAAVFAAIVLSDSKRNVPVVIFCYYALYIALWSSNFSGISAYEKVTLSSEGAAIWYLLFTSINLIVVIALLTLCKRTLLVKFYAAMVALSAVYNTFGLFFSALSMGWYSDIYLLHQQYAIQLDIIVAWLASDNVISRKINGAFYGAGKKGHEHGKPY